MLHSAPRRILSARMESGQGEIAALIVAAGRGHRAGGGLPKQYRALGGVPVLRRTLETFLAHPRIGRVTVAIHPDDAGLFEACAPPDEPRLSAVVGGASRAESVLAGLRSFDPPPVGILVHDAARPFVSAPVIDAVIAGLSRAEGTVASLPAVDAMRFADESGRLGEAVSRDGVARAQTPQGFRHSALRGVLEEAQARGELAALPDEAAAMIAAGADIRAVPGDPRNFKLTTAEDFTMAEALLTAPPPPDVRTGQGFDVHAFGPGDSVTLCGVAIPHSAGLSGHSDADVGLHALTDALLGAVAAGDIGRHFPPGEAEWKGADSAIFLRRSVELVGEAGYRIANIDVTLICERPKIGPHADEMCARIALLCDLPAGRVSVKATTSERLGFCGREEGIAAMAIATVIGDAA